MAGTEMPHSQFAMQMLSEMAGIARRVYTEEFEEEPTAAMVHVAVTAVRQMDEFPKAIQREVANQMADLFDKADEMMKSGMMETMLEQDGVGKVIKIPQTPEDAIFEEIVRLYDEADADDDYPVN